MRASPYRELAAHEPEEPIDCVVPIPVALLWIASSLLWTGWSVLIVYVCWLGLPQKVGTMSDLSSAERKLLRYLLSRAADEFSNHGCNDLDLVKAVGLTATESYEIRKAANDHPVIGIEGRVKTPRSDHTTYDWHMFQYLAERVDPEGRDD